MEKGYSESLVVRVGLDGPLGVAVNSNCCGVRVDIVDYEPTCSRCGRECDYETNAEHYGSYNCYRPNEPYLSDEEYEEFG